MRHHWSNYFWIFLQLIATVSQPSLWIVQIHHHQYNSRNKQTNKFNYSAQQLSYGGVYPHPQTAFLIWLWWCGGVVSHCSMLWWCCWCHIVWSSGDVVSVTLYDLVIRCRLTHLICNNSKHATWRFMLIMGHNSKLFKNVLLAFFMCPLLFLYANCIFYAPLAFLRCWFHKQFC